MKKKTKKTKKIVMVEVCRSFSYKKNLGNYENIDFFCSAKKEVSEKDMATASEALYLFCRAEVIKSVNFKEKAGKKEKDIIPEIPVKKPLTKVQRLKRSEKFQVAKDGAEHDAGAGEYELTGAGDQD